MFARAVIISGYVAAGFFPAAVFAAGDKLVPAIWVDPDGCEHWVIDDGAEGYMTPNVRRDGTPVCRGDPVCGVIGSDILFETASDTVTSNGRARLREIFDASPARAYTVSGHTDSRGSDEYNMDLARRRAVAAAKVAKELGAPISSVVAYGERHPRATNETAEGRRLNRRVEVICLK